jgi:exodeoxyribonuclease III
MKIASWNVNSLRVRLPQVLDWLKENKPDILAMQETKMTDALFPLQELSDAGYEIIFSGQKTYNGVALLSRQPGQDVRFDVPELDDPQRRIICATIGDVRILNLYVVNGSEVGTDKFDYKLNWLDKVANFIREDMEDHERYIIMGDFNIAPDDRDVHDPVAWHEKILCSTPERDALKRILDLGFEDSFRLFEQKDNVFSWWDYRAAGFRRNKGLRIDLILASTYMAERCKGSWVDMEPRKLERPSDHAPVVAEFELT